MNINQENSIIELNNILSTFNCDGLTCEECPLCLNDNNYNCMCLKISKEHTEIMIRRGAWARDDKGRLIKRDL